MTTQLREAMMRGIGTVSRVRPFRLGAIVLVLGFPVSAIAQEVSDAAANASPYFYALSGLVFLGLVGVSAFFGHKILSGAYSLSGPQRFRLAVFLIALPPLVMMALLVKGFDGALLIGLVGGLFGFVAGTALTFFAPQIKPSN